MLHDMFYFGVLLPTIVVVLCFIIFLIVWFKCGLKQRFSKPQSRSHNSTQSSLVSGSGLPYPKGPPSKDYWELTIEPSTLPRGSVVSQVTQTEPKYIPGNFSMKSENWVYMCQDAAQKYREQLQMEERAREIQIWATNHSRSSSESSSIDSEVSSSRPCILDRRASPDQLFIHTSSRRQSPDSITKAEIHNFHRHSPILHTPNQDSNANLTSQNDNRINNNNNESELSEHGRRIEYLRNQEMKRQMDLQQWGPTPLCSPYAITNIVHTPAPPIRV